MHTASASAANGRVDGDSSSVAVTSTHESSVACEAPSVSSPSSLASGAVAVAGAAAARMVMSVCVGVPQASQGVGPAAAVVVSVNPFCVVDGIIDHESEPDRASLEADMSVAEELKESNCIFKQESI